MKAGAISKSSRNLPFFPAIEEGDEPDARRGSSNEENKGGANSVFQQE